MKIYEKPLIDIKTFDVEDIMEESGYYTSATNEKFKEIDSTATYTGVVFEW